MKGGEEVPFVVMNNILNTNKKIDVRYDIKVCIGVEEQRSSSRKMSGRRKRGEEVPFAVYV